MVGCDFKFDVVQLSHFINKKMEAQGSTDLSIVSQLFRKQKNIV